MLVRGKRYGWLMVTNNCSIAGCGVISVNREVGHMQFNEDITY